LRIKLSLLYLKIKAEGVVQNFAGE
jgi:hypothetical protein